MNIINNILFVIVGFENWIEMQIGDFALLYGYEQWEKIRKTSEEKL